MSILSPAMNYSPSSKLVRFFSQHDRGGTSNPSVLWGSIGIRPNAYQGFPPIRLFYGSLHPLFCIFYRTLWNVPRRVKRFHFSIDTMWVNHQSYLHSEGRSASSPVFIRGFPLDGYLMTLYDPCFAYFIALSINFCHIWTPVGQCAVSISQSTLHLSVGINPILKVLWD